MAGLDPAIHEPRLETVPRVDARHKAGHDELLKTPNLLNDSED
jgi:hypothetical protein